MSVSSNLCRLSDKELALLAIKLLSDRGAKEVSDAHVKSFMVIVRRYCEMLGEGDSHEPQSQ